MTQPDLVLMGRATGAFGLKGDLKVHSHAEDHQVFTRAGRIFLGPEPGGATPYEVTGARLHSGRLLLRLAGVADREQAEALKGMNLYLAAQDFPPLPEGEFYWHQAVGASVRLASGRVLGRLKGLASAGGRGLLVVEPPQGEDGNPAPGTDGKPLSELLIPDAPGMILHIDLAAGLVEVDPPEGLLESQGWPE